MWLQRLKRRKTEGSPLNSHLNSDNPSFVPQYTDSLEYRQLFLIIMHILGLKGDPIFHISIHSVNKNKAKIIDDDTDKFLHHKAPTQYLRI